MPKPGPVGSIHISSIAAREQTSAAQIAKASPPYNMKYFFIHFWHYLSILFLFFLIEAAQYECSYRRTAHHATAANVVVEQRDGGPCPLLMMTNKH